MKFRFRRLAAFAPAILCGAALLARAQDYSGGAKPGESSPAAPAAPAVSSKPDSNPAAPAPREPGPPPPAGMTLPAYDEKGALVRPEGTEKWVFVGGGLGMNYDEEEPGMKLFTNVFMQPEAYDHYARTGKFPEKTMLALEAYLPSSEESINRHGSFTGRQVGFEIALKDRERFEEGWAYFSFSGIGGSFRKTARAHAPADCFSCHAAHAADDNVFVQFYPRLKKLLEAREEERKGNEGTGE